MIILSSVLPYLHVSNVKVFPDVGRHDVPQPLQVLLPAEVLQRPVAPRHVLLNSVKVQTETLQQLLAEQNIYQREKMPIIINQREPGAMALHCSLRLRMRRN